MTYTPWPGSPSVSGGGAREVFVQSDEPAEPSNPDRAIWLPVPDGLVSFVDFRSLPDGALADLLTETNGGGDRDPLDITEAPLPFGVPGVIEGERLTHPVGSDAPPGRNIVVVQPGPIGQTWRITYGHGGVTERDTPLTTGQTATQNITYTGADGDGSGYILHTAAFEKASAGFGSGNATYIAIGRDDDGVAVLSYTPPEIALVDRILASGDRVALASEGSDVYKGYLNGDEVVSFTDDTYDPATLGAITLPTNSLDGDTWRNGIEWIAVTTGADFLPERDLLPPHRWNGTAWVPTGG